MPDNEKNTAFDAEETQTEPETASAPDKNDEDRRLERKAQAKKNRMLKRERARQLKAYNERRRVIPQNHRDIICPPDRFTPDPKKKAFGFVCRIFIILMAVFGLTVFVCDAFGFINMKDSVNAVSSLYVFLWSAVFVILFSLAGLVRQRGLAKLGAAVIAIGLTLVKMLPDPVMKPYEAILNTFNAARDHMAYMGYYALNQNPVPVSASTGTREEFIQATVFLFILFTSLLFVSCLLRRIRIGQFLAAGLYSAAIIFVIFEYNITRSNWGVTLLIAAFSAALVMAAYDALYMRAPKKDKTDLQTTLFEEEGAPSYPAILARRANKAQKKQEKLEAKKQKKAEKAERVSKGGPVKTVEEEIDDYFTTSKPKKVKEAKPKLSAAEKKESALQKKREKAEKLQKARSEKRELSEWRRFLERKTDAGAAMGGFAGAGMFVFAMILLIIPALTAKGPFKTVEAVDKKFEFYREYVTAILMGDDPALDLLSYENDKSNFESQPTEPRALYYKGEKYFTVESNSRYAVYLRGWVATDYDDETGSWVTAAPDSETMQTYRTLFQTYIDPSETVMYGFWRATERGSIPATDLYDYSTKIKSNTTLGFVVSQVNVKRYELKTKTLYMPSFNLRSGMITEKHTNGSTYRYLRAYGSEESSGLTYADFFDGIYSSYRASLKNNDGYSAVSMIPTMKNSAFYSNMAGAIDDINSARVAIADGCILVDSSSVVYKYAVENSDYSLLYYTVEYRTAPYVIGSAADGSELTAYDLVSSSASNGDGFKYVVIPEDIGNAVYKISADGTVKSKTITDIPDDKLLDEEGEEIYYRAPDLPYAVEFYECLTEDERNEVRSYLRVLDFYTAFVYDTYTKKSGSQVVKDFTQQFLDNATEKASEEYEETDPETGEVYTLTRSIQVHADYSAAAGSNTYTKDENSLEQHLDYSSVQGEATYKRRHQLVMAIIDYLTDEDNFKYTLYPQISSSETLIGIEKFIADTREGSCVQYATTAVLMLREMGIPARFVSGYVAGSFGANRDENKAASYIATVRDSNAHAWIEVWYDGVGWVQYETTPAYYDVMYESRSEGSSYSGGSSSGDEEEPVEEEPVEEMTPEELAELERQRKEAEFKALVRKIIIIVLSVLAGAAVVVLFFMYFFLRARKAHRERLALIAKIYGADKAEVPPTREEFRTLIDLTNLMLSKCGLLPKTGEFREEYAARLYKTCAGVLAASTKEENLTEVQRTMNALTEAKLIRMLDGIASEEFGFGCPTEDMPLLATFFRRMCAFEYRHVNPATRIWLWLFVHKL